MQRPHINYERIARALDFYKRQRQYEYVEVPWVVGKEAVDITRPPLSRRFDVTWGADPVGALVASGEQSLLDIRADLCPGRKYVCVTPCFRDDTPDQFHQREFMKVELMIVVWKHDPAEPALHTITQDARAFFGLFQSCGSTLQLTQTDIGQDLTIEGIEVGSYGCREHGDFRWVYGTGVAEPRLSQSLAVQEQRMAKELDELCR